MTISLEMTVLAQSLNRRFEYEADSWFWDRWSILKDTPARGDCDDYALTLAWLLSGCSMRKLIRNIWRGRVTFMHCVTDNGEDHLILGWGGYWIDNMGQQWLKHMPHNGHSRVSVPIVYAKMLGPVWTALVVAAATASVMAVVW